MGVSKNTFTFSKNIITVNQSSPDPLAHRVWVGQTLSLSELSLSLYPSSVKINPPPDPLSLRVWVGRSPTWSRPRHRLAYSHLLEAGILNIKCWVATSISGASIVQFWNVLPCEMLIFVFLCNALVSCWPLPSNLALTCYLQISSISAVSNFIFLFPDPQPFAAALRRVLAHLRCFLWSSRS